MAKINYQEKIMEICKDSAHRDWMVHPDRNRLIDQLNQARRRGDHVTVITTQKMLENGEAELLRRKLKESEDSRRSVQALRNNMSLEEQRKLNVKLLKLCIKLDGMDSDILEIEAMTEKFRKGSLNPFMPPALKLLSQQVKLYLGYIYNDQEQELVNAFCNDADKMDLMYENYAKSVQRKMEETYEKDHGKEQ